MGCGAPHSLAITVKSNPSSRFSRDHVSSSDRPMKGDANSPLPERIVVGVKNCDLAGLKIQDHVFFGLTPEDPRYVEAREKTILVTVDCTDCLDACFCPVVGEQPHPKAGFDINISPLSNRYLIESGSERGEQLLQQAADLLTTADDQLLDERQRSRQVMHQRVVDQAAERGLRPSMDLTAAIQGSVESKMWDEFAVDCVECGACNFVCCTCHCFRAVGTEPAQTTSQSAVNNGTPAC